MADELGAVRRTPRPTGDRQTPETAPQESAGTTITPSSVSGDHPGVREDVSGDLSGPWTDPVGTVRSHDDGSRAVKVTDGLTTHPWCSVTPRGTVWLADEDVAEWGTEREWRLEELRAKLAEDPDSILFPGPECDMEAYAALPPCAACEGGGQDTHGTVFEQPLAIHIAAPPVTIDGRRRQLCAWCGHVLLDTTHIVGLLDGEQPPPPWPDGTLVRIEDGVGTVVPYEPGAELPPGCCALPDDEPAAPGANPLDPECDCPPATCVPELGRSCRIWHANDEHDEAPGCCTACNGTGTVETGYPCEDCYATGHSHPETVSCDGAQAADGPDEAQETRAATDWPAEPEDGDRG